MNEDILTVAETINLVEVQIGKGLREIDSERTLYRSEKDVPTKTTKYAILDNGFIVGTSEIFSKKTTVIEVDGIPMSSTDYFREYKYLFNIIAAKVSPDIYLTTYAHRLWHDDFHHRYFGQFSHLGVREVGNIFDSSIPIDQQGWESRATFPITISFIAKETEITGFVESVTGAIRVRDTPVINNPISISS